MVNTGCSETLSRKHLHTEDALRLSLCESCMTHVRVIVSACKYYDVRARVPHPFQIWNGAGFRYNRYGIRLRLNHALLMVMWLRITSAMLRYSFSDKSHHVTVLFC